MEKNNLRKNGRSGAVLTLVGFMMMVMVFLYLIYDLNEKNKELEEVNLILTEERDDLNEIAVKLQNSLANSETRVDSLISTNTMGLWNQAKEVNTLLAYSAYAQDHPNDTIHGKDLEKAVNDLLNSKGYVQIVESNGNSLFKKADLNLEGEYLIAKTALSVRKGVIGKDKNVERSGIILKGQTVKLIQRLSSGYSQWGKILYKK